MLQYMHITIINNAESFAATVLSVNYL